MVTAVPVVRVGRRKYWVGMYAYKLGAGEANYQRKNNVPYYRGHLRHIVNFLTADDRDRSRRELGRDAFGKTIIATNHKEAPSISAGTQ